MRAPYTPARRQMKYLSTKSTQRNHVRHVRTQGCQARKHVCTPNTQARKAGKHTSTPTTKSRKHASTRASQANNTQVSRFRSVYWNIRGTSSVILRKY